MNIRTYQPGDEFAQLKIYNTAAASQTRFKPATIVDLQRRISAKDFEPLTRFYAVTGNAVVGYCTYSLNGRVSYPWCLPGHEAAAEPLFAQTLQAMQQRGLDKAFCAYRGDWPTINTFFEQHGFARVREMVNFFLKFENMPTPSAKIGSLITPLAIDDIPAILELDRSVFRVDSAEGLKQTIWENPYFSSDDVFVMRNRTDNMPIAAGIFITNPQYADPQAVDSSMPCFRLGAFGAEGMSAKRIRGVFSFITSPDRNVFSTGMDMLRYATYQLADNDDIAAFAAQVATDAKALFTFYERIFERQGSFPVYERHLA